MRVAPGAAAAPLATARWIAALGVFVTLCALATPVRAATTQESIFMDDNQLLYRGDQVSDRTLRKLKSLGVDRVRVSVPWWNFTPGRDADRPPPTFRNATAIDQYEAATFDNWDHLLRVARQLEMSVLFNVTGPAPRWAAGRKNGRFVGGLYKPDPVRFEKFMRMLGTRYDGRHADENQGKGPLPRVDAWSIWNEPNQAGHLQPQWERKGRRWVPAAPRIYRSLVRAAGRALKATGHGSDLVLIGETAPIGLPGKGTKRSMAPIPFLAALLCIDQATLRPLWGRAMRDVGCDYARRGRLPGNGFAHHPYGVVDAPDKSDPDPNNARLVDGARIARLLDAPGSRRRVARGLPFWWTEFGYQTNPPDPTPRGIALDLQATWLAQAERITWADPRVAGMTQFLLRDDDPSDRFPEGDPQRWRTYQTGIEFADGSPKPAFEAYRLPLVGPAVAPAGKPVRLWGLVRPGTAGQQIRIQFAPEGATTFQDVGEPVTITDPRGYFEADVTHSGSGRYRFTWLAPGSTGTNPNFLERIGGKRPTGPTPLSSVAVVVRAG